MPRITLRDGEQVNVICVGKGEPVVLLHRFGSCAAHWLPNVLPLSHRFRFYLPDLRGLGLLPPCPTAAGQCLCDLCAGPGRPARSLRAGASGAGGHHRDTVMALFRRALNRPLARQTVELAARYAERLLTRYMMPVERWQEYLDVMESFMQIPARRCRPSRCRPR